MSANMAHGIVQAPSMFNAAQWALMQHYESAVREYCNSVGENPDEERYIPHPTIFGAQCTLKRWYDHVDRLVDMNMMWLALARTQADRLPPTTAPATAVPAAEAPAA